ncbi:FxsA family protein [Streptomyces sp. LX-29]|uniref:FxsA family membrane protein n=1 Tax=Streptomyces sp. LX-29 TaxID=2900152 RepID=UPI00240E96B8|nr:FxsA family membrane protein [Streptomyces sp. LX-29]WFB06475.1 FxsA family protein [Streptomyces sp. LX-29]
MTTGTPHQTGPTRPQRSRTRTFLPLIVAAWLVLEVWLLMLVGEAAGGLTVFLLLVAGMVLGAVVIKRAGRRAWRSLSESFQQPGAALREDGTERGSGRGGAGGSASGNALPMLGGLLLMLPGLLSDVAGLLCLFPPTRALLRSRVERALDRRMRAATPGGLEDVLQQARMHRPDGKVVQGEVIRDEPRSDAPRREDPPLTR